VNFKRNAEIVRLPKSMVVIPTYNEASNVERLVELILSQSPDLSLLVIDDNSPDGTGDELDRLARRHARLRVIHRSRKMGLGSAYREGFARVAAEGSSKYIVEMDADFSHDPGALPVLIEAAEREKADLVIGSRYVPGGRINGWNKGRLFLSSNANRLCSFLLGSRIRDYTSGFRCYRAGSMYLFGLDTIRSEGYAFQVEMTTRVLNAGKKIAEIPIVFSERREGVSKFGRKILIEAVKMLVLLFLKRLVR
jgi:dolichol-phosphate mannosyltransferase